MKLQFDKNRRKVEFCPCGRNNKDGKFAPFRGYEDKGHCHSCGKTFMPESNEKVQRYIPPPPKPPSYIDEKRVRQLLQYGMSTAERGRQNNFIQHLIDIFGIIVTTKLLEMYPTGTQNGAAVFFYMDRLRNTRTGKVMFYYKHKFNRTGKVYQIHHETPGFNFVGCFYGEHQLKHNKPIAIVESEKTAFVASVYHSDITWLATGGKENLKPDFFRCLKGKQVTLVPDLNAYEKWCDMQIKIQRQFPEILFTPVYDELEMIATDEQRKQKLDIADFLIHNDPAPHIDAFLKSC